jgi:hypothetical protein
LEAAPYILYLLGGQSSPCLADSIHIQDVIGSGAVGEIIGSVVCSVTIQVSHVLTRNLRAEEGVGDQLVHRRPGRAVPQYHK